MGKKSMALFFWLSLLFSDLWLFLFHKKKNHIFFHSMHSLSHLYSSCRDEDDLSYYKKVRVSCEAGYSVLHLTGFLAAWLWSTRPQSAATPFAWYRRILFFISTLGRFVLALEEKSQWEVSRTGCVKTPQNLFLPLKLKKSLIDQTQQSSKAVADEQEEKWRGFHLPTWAKGLSTVEQ